MFAYYLDLVESLAEVGLTGQFALGLLDLGLSHEQARAIESLGIARINPAWPIAPPPHESSMDFFGLAAKAYLRQFFPGYTLYVWMDADMWVQSADFWEHLYDPAMKGSLAVPAEAHDRYRRSLRLAMWMFARYQEGIGTAAAIRMVNKPVINNALAALRADAPHWDIWQREYESMVAKIGRLPGIDQLSLSSVVFRHGHTVRLMPPTDNWICSRCVPAWDADSHQFVVPGPARERISVIHLTRPVRGRKLSVATTEGGSLRTFLHRPNGHASRLELPVSRQAA